MPETIYADVLFLTNFCMDFFILYLTSHLARTNTSAVRMAFGGLLAAGLSIIPLFFPAFRVLYSAAGSFFMLAVTVLATFQPRRAGGFLVLVFFAYLSSFVMGGLIFALMYTGAGKRPFSFKLLFLAVLSMYLVLKTGRGILNVKLQNPERFCRLLITMAEKQAEVTALIDTGNELKDAITKAPVAVVEFRKIRQFFPADVQLLFYQQKEPPPEQVMEKLSETKIGRKLRLIPFSSLGKENGMLLGFVPDTLEVLLPNGKRANKKQAVIGICNRPLSQGEGYTALVGMEMIKEESAWSI